MIEKGEWEVDTTIPTDLNDLPNKVLTHFNIVCEVAYRCIFNKVVEVSITTDGFQHLGLLNETKEMYVSEGAKSTWVFHHLMIHEFLVAWYISNNPNLIHSIKHQYFVNEWDNPPFGLFLAGLMGCSKLPGIEQSPKSILYCYYEAQNPNEHIKQLKFSTAVSLSNSFDMYVLGYALVHMPMQWEVLTQTSMDMLFSSIADHAEANKRLLGSINKLYLSHFDPHTRPIPECLLESINNEVIAYPHINALPLVKNLYFIKEIDFTFYKISIQGVDQLCHLFSNTIHLNSIKLSSYETNLASQDILEYNKLVSAAMSCSTVKSITLENIPMCVNYRKVSSSLQHVSFEASYGGRWLSEDSFVTLISLASLCKLRALKTLNVSIHPSNEVPASVLLAFKMALYFYGSSKKDVRLDGLAATSYPRVLSVSLLKFFVFIYICLIIPRPLLQYFIHHLLLCPQQSWYIVLNWAVVLIGLCNFSWHSHRFM